MIDIKRNLEAKVHQMLQLFPIVALLGARQVGKTTLAKTLMPTGKYVDLENPDDFDLIEQSPTLFFDHYPQNVIIDEAQSYPELFGILRGVIDNAREEKGRFIITGSSSPELLSHISQTLAGRICIIELGTLKANEFYQKPLSSFYDLFSTKLSKKNVISGTPPLSTSEMQQMWFKGGYPEPVLANNPIFYQHWMENYRDTYIHRDIAKLFPKLNRRNYQRFLSMLSKLSGTILNKSDLGRALEINESTIKNYLEIVSGTFIWRSLSSYEKNIVKAVIKMPKGYIRDAGLLHYMTKIHSFEDLIENPLVGISFEAFAIEEMLKGLNATFVSNWDAHYYRTRNGAEIDLILEGIFGILPIEIKYGSSVRLKEISSLIQFVEEHHLEMGIVINQSKTVEWIHPKIVQIPIGWL